VPPSPILVTGASGNVGSTVVDQLLERGQHVRAADIVTSQLPSGAEPVRLDLTDPATFAPALRGVRRLFLIRPPAIARVKPTLNAFLDAATEAGVDHVVFSSVAGAETNRLVPHHRVEQHLLASPMSWTMLRPGFFAQNLAGAYRTDIRDHDRIHVPAGDGRVAFIDTRDLGELAAMILADPTGHAGQGYTLTGPRAVTFVQVASLLSDQLGRTIRYEPAGLLGYIRHLGRQGLPVAQRLVQTVLHAGLRRGDAETVETTIEELLGRAPRDIASYIADHASLWQRAPVSS
jgi:uncharacterized protein YbjT (DUF2867 family)